MRFSLGLYGSARVTFRRSLVVSSWICVVGPSTKSTTKVTWRGLQSRFCGSMSCAEFCEPIRHHRMRGRTRCPRSHPRCLSSPLKPSCKSHQVSSHHALHKRLHGVTDYSRGPLTWQGWKCRADCTSHTGQRCCCTQLCGVGNPQVRP